MTVNKLILGDNLAILKSMDKESIDLIYLDPPFFSNRNYEVIWGDDGEIRSFQDRWSGGIDHYISWLKERVFEMHRILKPTGSIFLHCDWHADAYIRVEILDKIFGLNNFRNHIIWKRNSAHNSADKCGAIHDSIFYYQKTNKHKWNIIYQNYNEQYLDEFFDCIDENGRKYKRADLTGAGISKGASGKIWRNIDVTAKGRHWAYVPEELEKLDSEGKIHWTKKDDGMPRLKVYPEDMKGIPLQDVWDDIKVLHNLSKERIGYPTQKPEALLERIINCASNEGDIVLDPFMGGGTTIAVADNLNRQWIGIDQSVQAVKVTELRLHKQTDLFTNIYANSYTLQLHKYDYDTLRNKDAYEFESWIIGQFGGVPRNQKGGDAGVDGVAQDGAPIQVKRSEGIGVNVIKNFSVSAKQFDKTKFQKNIKSGKPAGYIIAFSFGKGAVQEVARLKNQENIIIRLVAVDTIIPVSKKPNIKIEVTELERDASGMREILFVASSKNSSDVEFYSWDFDYDADKGFKSSIIRDTEGKQQKHLKAGIYHIAVKAVDNNGLESIEILKLKVNGSVERTT
jgi:DNA modification methylase